MKKIILCMLLTLLLSPNLFADEIKESMKLTLKAKEVVQKGDIEKGFSLLEKALELNPNNYVALTELAGLYGQSQQSFNKSTELFKQALAIEDYDMAHFGLGVNYFTMGMHEKAKREFEKTVEITDNKSLKDAAKRALIMLEQQQK